MKAAARQRAHRKRRRDSGFVGQATTNEPIDTRVPACYACSTLVLVGSGGGTASVWLATFKPMSCLFSLVVAGALQRPRAVTLRPRPPTAVEAVNLTIHRSHSTAAATNKNTQGTENDSPSPARSNVLRLSLAAGNAPFYTAINSLYHSTPKSMPSVPFVSEERKVLIIPALTLFRNLLNASASAA